MRLSAGRLRALVCFLGLTLVGQVDTVVADVKVPNVFSSHMVLQQASKESRVGQSQRG